MFVMLCCILPNAMSYVPEIIDYKPFYIQANSNIAINTTVWGMVAKSNPYPVLPTPKEPFKNEWLDENGDDEYVGEMFYEAFEIDVSFYVKTLGAEADGLMIGQLNLFLGTIKNKNLKIYDSYTGLGWQKVRYAGYKEDRYDKGDGWARLIFTVTFKVNDPVTRMKMEGNQIVEA